jgi:2,3-bisphosphoglycerate-independent phosphoglycerate mutase
VRSLLVLLLDGLGDRATAALGGRTANEAAWTPNLDALAARGSCGLLSPLGPGRAPSSEVAHWAMLGYRPDEFPGRAVLEALGHGLAVGPDEVVAHAALRPAERRGDALWVTGRAGAGDAAEALALLGGLGRVGVGRLSLALSAIGLPGEAILRIAGGAHDGVTDTDPFFRERLPVLRPRPMVDEARDTARAVELWSRRAVRTLARHPVNRARAERGAPALAVVTLKWWGRHRAAPAFRARHGLGGAIVGASPFLGGLAAQLGLEFVHCGECGFPARDLELRLQLARARLDRGDAFVLCHLKATDEAGHTKDPRLKRRAIEAVDHGLARLVERFPDAVVCVTGDHATPTAPEVIHSGDPVPFLLAGAGVRADRVTRFGELPCAEGILGRLVGGDVMPVLLNAADRPLFLGSRPTPVPGAMGAPAPEDAEPLQVDRPSTWPVFCRANTERGKDAGSPAIGDNGATEDAASR